MPRARSAAGRAGALSAGPAHPRPGSLPPAGSLGPASGERFSWGWPFPGGEGLLVKAVPPARTCGSAVPGVQWKLKPVRVSKITTLQRKVFRFPSTNDLNCEYWYIFEGLALFSPSSVPWLYPSPASPALLSVTSWPTLHPLAGSARGKGCAGCSCSCSALPQLSGMTTSPRGHYTGSPSHLSS